MAGGLGTVVLRSMELKLSESSRVWPVAWVPLAEVSQCLSATYKRTLSRTSRVGCPPVGNPSRGIEQICSSLVFSMKTDLIQCQCNTGCQCRVEAAKAVIRDGKAFCCLSCADGLGCGCR